MGQAMNREGWTDPLKETPDCELDRDNRIMTREAEGERACRESKRAEVELDILERLWRAQHVVLGPAADEIRRLRRENKRLRLERDRPR
jgi:hypothetical protein